MGINKYVLCYILVMIFNFYETMAQIDTIDVENVKSVSLNTQNETGIKGHSFGISLLPLFEPLVFRNAFAITTIYSYAPKVSDLRINTSISYFNKGEKSFRDILGGGKNFNINGGQLKVGISYITNGHKIPLKKVTMYNIVGFGFSLSNYDIYQEIMLGDELGNIKYFPRAINFYTKSFEFQWGKLIKISKRLYLTTYINTGLINLSQQEGIPITKLPAIGYFGSTSGLFINGNVELFYNIK